jgi:hypothetical protein
MADLPKVVMACCAKESFIHLNNALMFCHNTAMYVFSEKNYLCPCLCLDTRLCNVVYTEGSSSTVTHALRQSHPPLYTISTYTHSESDNDNFGLFCCPLALNLVSTATGASRIKKFRCLSGFGIRGSDVLVVLE